MRDQDSNLALATCWSCHLGLVTVYVMTPRLTQLAHWPRAQSMPAHTGPAVAQYR